MKLTILGSGTGYPLLKRSAPAYLLKIGKDLILLDSGDGTKRRLLEAGIDDSQIGYIFYTHTHTDHVSELPALIWGWTWPGKHRRKKLTIVGPRGFKKFFREILRLFYSGFYKDAKFEVSIKEVKNTKLKFGNWKVLSRYMHKQRAYLSSSVAFRFEHKNKSMIYTGDISYNYNKDLINLAKDVDLLLIDSALPEQLKEEGHLTPSRAGEIATLAGVKKLVLTHFYPPCEKYDIKKQAQKTYKGPIILAKDLMKIKI